MWLKCHTEDIRAGIAGVDEKTYSEKVWFYLEGIARLDTMVVSSDDGNGVSVGVGEHQCWQASVSASVYNSPFLSLLLSAASVAQPIDGTHWTAMPGVC